MLDTNAYKEFIEMHNRKKELEADLKELKAEMENKKRYLIDNLESNDMASIKIFNKNCYINKITVASVSDKKAAIKLLKENGFEDYVTEGINSQQISKLVRDQLAEYGELPKIFGDIIKSFDKEDLRVKKS